MNVNLTPTEASLLAAVVNEKIEWLDQSIERLKAQADEADGWALVYEAQDANRLMRSVYAGIVRRLEQILDVPFMDEDEALAVLIGRAS
jgi:hypothetical protein